MSFVAHLLALLCFVLGAFGVKPGGFDMTLGGLAFLTLGFLLGGGWPSWLPRTHG